MKSLVTGTTDWPQTGKSVPHPKNMSNFGFVELCRKKQYVQPVEKATEFSIVVK
jgi:hypothetical protein